MLQEMLIVGMLVLLNGLFSMAELAMVSARRVRLQQLADTGNRGARAALGITESPGRFLSTVQVGITLVGVLAGAFSGAAFADPLAALLGDFPYADEIAFATVVAAITYASIVVGELVPKQIAMNHAVFIAAAASRPMNLLSRLALPLVALLDMSAAVLLRMLGQERIAEQAASEEEVRRLIAESTRVGVFSSDEGILIDRVMGLADRNLRTVMTHRLDVEWIDATLPNDEALASLRKTGHSRVPVCRGRIDDVVGILRTRDVLDRLLDGVVPDLVALVHPAPFVPNTASVLDALDAVKASPIHAAVVVDEFGAFHGMVTDADLLEALAGGMNQTDGSSDFPVAVQRADGSWLVDADMDLEEARRRLSWAPEHLGAYHTLAGFVLAKLGHVPQAGEIVRQEGWTIEVLDMDGPRIDKILVTGPASLDCPHPS